MEVTLTLQRLMTALDTTFRDLIDMRDVSKDSPEEQRKHFLSRALAAFAITSLTECPAREAAASITDGFNDQGIDAIHFDAGEKTVYLVQSKWSSNGTKTIDLGEFEKFLKGVQRLILPDFSGFNEKICNREEEIKNNLLLQSDVKVVLVIAHSGTNPLGEHIQTSLETFLKEENNVGDIEVFVSETFDLRRFYGRLSGMTNGKISFQIALQEWGTIKDPYRAYYGQVMVSEIAGWAPTGNNYSPRTYDTFVGLRTLMKVSKRLYWSNQPTSGISITA